MRIRTQADRQGRWLRTGWSGIPAVLVALAATAALAVEDDSFSGAEPGVVTPGTLFICGGGRLPEAALRRFVDLAGGPSAHVVVITTASETAESSDVDIRIDFWKRARFAEMTVLHTRSRDTANDPTFCLPLQSATGVWFIGGNQDRLIETYRGTLVEQSIRGVLERGGIVGGTSAGAAVMSPIMIRGGNQRAIIGDGFGLLPGTVIDQHFLKRKREDRLIGVLASHPRFVGLGIDEGTALVVRGRTLTVVPESESNVVTYLAPQDGRPARRTTLEPGEEADLVALRRAALARLQPRVRFDEEQPIPGVPEGTLILAGGGELPAEAARRFIDAAGGAEALLVVVTTADGESPPAEAESTGWLKAAGARRVHRIHPRTARDAEEDAVLELLRQADGVWFAGGRQWRIVDAFRDTAAERLLHEVLQRGGVIGGSAAGASVLAGYLVRGNPLTNRQMMAEGYEEGFGFLPGTAVDPYFSQRHRLADMLELKRTYPHLVGLGVDERTAVVIRQHELEVLGRHSVRIFDRGEVTTEAESERQFVVLAAGGRYDLNGRQPMGSDPEEDLVLVAADAGAQDDSEEDTDDDDSRPDPPLVCE